MYLKKNQTAPEPAAKVVDTQSATADQLANPETRQRAYRPRGGAKELMGCREPEVILHSAAGTGKSRACLEKLYAVAQKYPGSRCAIVRKFRSTITQSAMNTFDELVRVMGDGVKFNTVSQEYIFPNGSVIVVAGLDELQKILSTEYDVIYVQECTEIEEDIWETLTSRLRWQHVPYQQIIGDCNPSSERHWIRRRWRANKLKMIQMTFKDNPLWWDEENEVWTEAGEKYIQRLKNLSGVMRQRLYEGLWVAAEGMVYTEFNAKKNVIDRFPIPNFWSRYVSIDWGYTNPLTIQWWAEDHDGRLYLYREFYQTQMAVEDVGHIFHDLSEGETFKAIICDHDAEDRETFSRHAAHSADDCIIGKTKNFNKVNRKRVPTQPADKRRESIRQGVEKVQARLRYAGDYRPRLFFFRDALVEQDAKLVEAKKPTNLLDEIEEYVWDEIVGGRLGDRVLEQPKKLHDHGCLSGDTLITTDWGTVPLRDIYVGDHVLTRQGFKKVLDAHQTSAAAVVRKLTFSNGLIMFATPDHPFWTTNRGWVPCDDVRYSDILVSDMFWEPLCQLSTSNSKVQPIEDTQMPQTSVIAITSDLPPDQEKNISIERSIKTTRDQSLQAITFTMRIRTLLTTIRRTLSASLKKSMQQFTKRSGGPEVARSTRFSISNVSNLRQRSGTPPMKVTTGTASMLGTPSVLALTSPGRAKCAERNSRLEIPGPSSVATLASRLPVVGAGWIKKTVRALCVTQDFEPTVTLPEKRAEVRVVDNSVYPVLLPTYNLTVEDAHEFFANGVLVSNCDAMRYAVTFIDSGTNAVPVEIWGSKAKNTYGNGSTKEAASKVWGSKNNPMVVKWR